MVKVLVVGCGDLGAEVMQLLAASGQDVMGVRSSNKFLPNNLPCIQADVTQLSSLNPLEKVFPHIIVYCVAAKVPSDDGYRTHYVDGLNNVLTTQMNNSLLQHVFFISSTRVYGQMTSQLLNENVTAVPNDFGGERLLEAEALLEGLSCGGTSVRLSGIYGRDRLSMVNLAKDPARWPPANRWTNRIHRDDAARFIAFLCEKVIAGDAIQHCYIGTDDMPTLQYDVLGWLANKLNVDVPEMNVERQVNGRRFSNRRMHDAGFQLTYANYQCGYREVLKDV